VCKNRPVSFWPLLPSQPRSDRACLLGLFSALAVNFKLLCAGLVPQRLAIDAALERIRRGVYGVCVTSRQAIPKERLKAIPWAAERVEVKAGGLGRR